VFQQKDKNTLKKAMLTLKEKTAKDFKLLSGKVGEFHQFHHAEMEKWKLAYQVCGGGKREKKGIFLFFFVYDD
jgi:hypothetical protein